MTNRERAARERGHDDGGCEDIGSDSIKRDTPAVQHLTGLDVVLLIGFAALGFLVLDDFVQAPVSRSLVPVENAPKRQQVCSEEELRQMRAGMEACFDDVPPNAGEGDRREPSVRFLQNS